jgi:hypothetical protein
MEDRKKNQDDKNVLREKRNDKELSAKTARHTKSRCGSV